MSPEEAKCVTLKGQMRVLSKGGEVREVTRCGLSGVEDTLEAEMTFVRPVRVDFMREITGVGDTVTVVVMVPTSLPCFETASSVTPSSCSRSTGIA